MAAGETAIEYNGVTIYNCQTQLFDQTSVFDQSDTTLLYTLFRIRVTGYIHGQGSSTTVGTNYTSNSSASDVHGTVREMLMEPRRQFEMRVGTNAQGQGGQTLVSAHKASRVIGPTSDLNNGPKPRNCTLSRIAGNNLFRVEYEIELALNECANSSTLVLSNRWQSQDSLDHNLFTTRNINGTLRLAAAITNPHDFRGWVVPPLQQGMRRESMNFTATPDGLTLQYTIVDREVLFAPPSPATDWHVTHRESAGDHGVTMMGSVDVSLSGDRDAPQKTLLRLAAAVVEQKLLATGGGFNLDIVHLRSYDAMTDQGSNGNNRVSVSARYERLARVAPNGKGRILVATTELGEILPPGMFDGILDGNGGNVQYDPDRSPGGRPGEAPYLSGPVPVAGALVAYMQQQCGSDEPVHAIAGGREAVEGSGVAGVRPNVRLRVKDLVTDEYDQRFTLEHNESIYTNYQTQSDYHEDEQTIQLPVAGETGNWGSSIYDHETGEYKTGKASEFAALAPRQTKRVIRIDAQRVGAEPKLPKEQFKYDDPELQATMYLIGKKIRQFDPVPQPGGNYVYRTMAEWVFGADRPVGAWKKQPPATLKPENKVKNSQPSFSLGAFAGEYPFIYDVDRTFIQKYGAGNKH